MIDALRREISSCDTCANLVDDEGRRRKFESCGSYTSRWMIIGEAPGKRSVDNGRPWSSSPYLVRKTVEKIRHPREARTLSLELDFYLTDVVKCLPPGNRTPTKDEVLSCEKFLLNEIELIKPLVIITFGQTASRFILRHFDCEPEIRSHSMITFLHKTYTEPICIRNGDDQMMWRPFMHPRWSFKFLGNAARFEGSVSQGIRLAIQEQQSDDQLLG